MLSEKVPSVEPSTAGKEGVWEGGRRPTKREWSRGPRRPPSALFTLGRNLHCPGSSLGMAHPRPRTGRRGETVHRVCRRAYIADPWRVSVSECCVWYICVVCLCAGAGRCVFGTYLWYVCMYVYVWYTCLMCVCVCGMCWVCGVWYEYVCIYGMYVGGCACMYLIWCVFMWGGH